MYTSTTFPPDVKKIRSQVLGWTSTRNDVWNSLEQPLTYIDSRVGKQTTNGVATVAGNDESNVKRTKVLEELAGACCGCAEQ